MAKKLTDTDIDEIIAEALREREERKLSSRSKLTREEIELLTDRGLAAGATSASREFNRSREPGQQCSRERVQKYVTFFRQNGRYFSCAKRGRPTLLKQEAPAGDRRVSVDEEEHQQAPAPQGQTTEDLCS